MEEKEFYIPCDDCEYYLDKCCVCPDDVEKPCKKGVDGANVGLGTLYDLNKNIMSKSPKLSEKQVKELITDLALSLGNRYKYYMLLNNETRDYTLFAFRNNNTACIEFRDDIYECLDYRGEVLSISPTQEANVYEIWLRKGETILCFYFFPYDLGVLEYA